MAVTLKTGCGTAVDRIGGDVLHGNECYGAD